MDHLCVTFGYCLPSDAKRVLRTNPPQGAQAFADAVITAEGMDPDSLDATLRRRMRDMVEQEAGQFL